MRVGILSAAEEVTLPPFDGEGGSRSKPGRVDRPPPSVSRARALRKRLTPQEARLWLRLRALREQDLHFRRQAPLFGYILDFVCFDRRLVVEIDGAHHATGAQFSADIVRDELLRANDFEVLRFWNSDVATDIDAVVETIFARAVEQPPTRRRWRDATLPTRGREARPQSVEDVPSVAELGTLPPLDGEGGSRSEPGGVVRASRSTEHRAP